MSSANGEGSSRSSSTANTILVLHDFELDPRPVLHRLKQSSEVSSTAQDNESTEIPWVIDNKYYTAPVTFRCRPVELDVPAKGIEVVLYLFEGDPPNPLPPALVKLITEEPRDIALALRILAGVHPEEDDDDDNRASSKAHSMAWEDIQELFDELGMEVVDEQGEVEEDDERPINPLESIRQTLMTHMWPNMVRKPLGVVMTIPDDDDEDYRAEEANEEEEQRTPDFPVTFGGVGATGPAASVQAGKEDGFPTLQELRAQVSANEPRPEGEAGPSSSSSRVSDSQVEDRRMEGTTERQLSALERLEMLELDDDLFGDLSASRGFGGPGEEEYARLDDWLDDDDEGGGPEGMDSMGAEGDEGFVMLDRSLSDHLGADASGEGSSNRTAQLVRVEHQDGAKPKAEEGDADEGFEDDFAAFQSAPHMGSSGSTRGGAQLPLDPTPLLLHLQAVRAELMGVEDPDERRKRAGREVEMIMRGLGMDAGLGLDDLDNLA